MAKLKLEKDLEARCRALVKEHGGELITFRTKAKGWHDRLLLLPADREAGYIALIEFKRSKGAAVQPLQDDRQAWCEERLIPAFRVWTFAQFKYVVECRPEYVDHYFEINGRSLHDNV